MFDARAFLATLTERPGVYRMIDAAERVLYVGKAKNLKRRVSSYFREHLPSPRIAHMVSQIDHIDITVTASEAEALLLESNLIKRLAPRYNIVFRDDKSYPYIVMKHGEFPRLALFRGTPKGKDDYFGPFPSALAVRESLALLQKMFHLRTCEDAVFNYRSRPCLLYQIKRCSGACVGKISREDYAADIRLAQLFLSGRQQDVLRRLQALMDEAAERLAFEQAATYRDQIRALHQVRGEQFITSERGEDADIVVAANEGGQWCVNLAMVRGGRHLGDKALFPERAEDASAADTLDAFVRQHYAQHTPPHAVLLYPPPQGEEADALTALLSELAKRPVQLVSARSRTQKAWLEMARQNAALAIARASAGSERQQARQQALFDALQSFLPLPDVPHHLECFDISHTLGEAAVASCVVYHHDAMQHSDYRRFNMQGITPGDDYAAMHQAVSRRYARLLPAQDEREKPLAKAEQAGETPLGAPDIILIDGGLGQVRAAFAALCDLGLGHLPMIGIAKGVERKPGLETLVRAGGETFSLPPEHPGLHLLQEVRDESHRFAITGHRRRRATARKSSALEDLPGIGPARRRALIACFGSMHGVRAASIAQIKTVPGISQNLAENIYRALHDDIGGESGVEKNSGGANDKAEEAADETADNNNGDNNSPSCSVETGEVGKVDKTVKRSKRCQE